MDLTNLPSVARGWPEDWLPIGTDGVGNDLVVDAEGSVWIWSSDIDVEPVLIHASFEQWVSELCHALDDGKLVIQREEYGDRIVYANEWSYERHGDGWERVARQPTGSARYGVGLCGELERMPTSTPAPKLQDLLVQRGASAQMADALITWLGKDVVVLLEAKP